MLLRLMWKVPSESRRLGGRYRGFHFRLLFSKGEEEPRIVFDGLDDL